MALLSTLRSTLYKSYCTVIPIKARIAVNRILGKPRKWTLAFVVLTSDEVHNFVNKVQMHILDQYGVKTATPHITLKLGFDVTDLEPYERYFDNLVKEIEPFEISINGIDKFEEIHFEEGIIFINVENSPHLDKLRRRILRDLHQQFGIKPYRLEGDQFHFHITLAYGLSKKNFRLAYEQLKKIPIQARFTLNKMSMLCHTGESWVSYKQSEITGTVNKELL